MLRLPTETKKGTARKKTTCCWGTPGAEVEKAAAAAEKKTDPRGLRGAARST